MAETYSNTSVIPMGYKFRPSDEELVYYYLIPKVVKRALPINLIYEVELKNYSPESLTEKYKPQGENTWYIFTQRDRKYRNGERPNRIAGDGYWRASGSETLVEHNNRIKIGSKRTLVFHRGKHPKGKKTNWIMYEYTAYRSSKQPRQRSSEDDMRLDEWVLCTIHQYHRHTGTTDVDNESNGDEENFKMVQLLNQNSPVEHSNDIQNNSMISYQAPVHNVMDPNSYNATLEQYNGIQDNHTTSFKPSEQNIKNANVTEDISTEELYEILFGPRKQNAMNPNIEESIPIQDHCTTSSQPLNQNVTDPNTFDNLGFVGGYGDFPVGQVDPHGQLYMSHPQDPLLLHCQRIFSSPSERFFNAESNLP